MLRKWTWLWAAVVVLPLWLGHTSSAQAQTPYTTSWNIGRYYYYPFYYFPHSYWPTQGPRWPEPPGAPYMRPPAYMSYPAFQEPHWRYDLWERHSYYRGFHFWLDQF
jgi:hypothetical protein